MNTKAARCFFDQAATDYEQYAVLQREITSRLLERVDFRRLEPSLLVDLGCATGAASSALAGQFQDADIISLDWSIGMLSASGQGAGANTHKLCADMHLLPLATGSADLVFSNLAISWGRDVPAVFVELRRVMKPGAMLVFTCFGPDTLMELAGAWQEAHAHSPVPGFPDLHDVGDELVRAGFREPVMDAERLVLEYPDVPSLLRELRATGIGVIGDGALHTAIDSLNMKELSEAYRSFCNGDRYPVSFEIIYGTAFAPEEGQPVKTPEGDVATFSVDALRARPRKKA